VFAKLLAVVLCLTGAFPQRACQCAEAGGTCAAVGNQDARPAPRKACPACVGGHGHARDVRSVPAPHPDSHRQPCRCTRAKPGLEATLASAVVVPTPEAAAFASVEPAAAVTRSSPVLLPVDSSPHVPWFLALLVLRN
jgi:hypothetical protein